MTAPQNSIDTGRRTVESNNRVDKSPGKHSISRDALSATRRSRKSCAKMIAMDKRRHELPLSHGQVSFMNVEIQGSSSHISDMNDQLNRTQARYSDLVVQKSERSNVIEPLPTGQAQVEPITPSLSNALGDPTQTSAKDPTLTGQNTPFQTFIPARGNSFATFLPPPTLHPWQPTASGILDGHHQSGERSICKLPDGGSQMGEEKWRNKIEADTSFYNTVRILFRTQ